MTIRWTEAALRDIDRVHTFLSAVNPDAADRTVKSLRTTAKRLSFYPRLGEELGITKGHPLRRLVVGSYELWYEDEPGAVLIHRVWNTRQHRSR